MGGPLTWKLTIKETYTLCEFQICAMDGMLTPQNLAQILLPEGAPASLGLVLSGKGPVWLYGFLTHLCHHYAWVAIHDPRLGGAVVVERHLPSAPGLGELIGLD